MAFLGQTFELDDMPQGNGNFEPVPASWYNVVITKAELKETKAGTGKFISVRFDITGPSYQGRVLFANLNVNNPSAKAEEIGRQQLGDIMRAIGLPRVQDTDELIGGNLAVKVIVKDDPVHGQSNEIKAFKAIEGNAPPKASVPAAKPQQQKAAAGSPPWASK